jgi:hypothetical protein
MTRSSLRLLAVTGLTVLCSSGLAFGAWAEGSAQIGSHTLSQETVLFVDVLDAGPETFVWTGTGSVTVREPGNQLLGTFASGATITPPVDGTYRVDLGADQTASWNVTVFNGFVAQTGRVHAYTWHLDAGSYDQASSSLYSLYALVPAGSPGDLVVFQLRMDGVTGFEYDLRANRTGVMGARAGTSVPAPGAIAAAELPLYLAPPEAATYTSSAPDAENLQANAASGGGYTFAFETSVESTYHVIVDADGDAAYDLVGDDVVLSGIAAPGSNEVYWNGRDRFGNELPPGDYGVKALIDVAECHFLIDDAETVYPGVRVFEVAASLSRFSTEMFWNDSEVQSEAVLMPNGQLGLETSQSTGVASGTFADPTVANVNAHSWGDFNLSGLGKGNDAFIDTYVWDQQAESEVEILTYTGPAPSVPSLGAWGLCVVAVATASAGWLAVERRSTAPVHSA